MKTRVIYSLLVVCVVILLDQITKYFVLLHIPPAGTIEVLPVFNLVNIRNEGAAFGLFRSLGNAFFVSISVFAIIFMVWIIVSGKEDWRVFSLLVGGACGNLIDRIVHGSVIDFVDVFVSGHHWPAFNVADSALTVGIVLLFVSLLKKK